MDMKIYAITFFMALSTFGKAQAQEQTYYRMKNGKILNEQQYDHAKKSAAERGKVEEMILKTELAPDSIIKTVRITILMKDDEGNYIDPYAQLKELIGKHFPIENFKTIDKSNFSETKLLGRPTVINFWFTRCVPCIAEISILNNLRQQYGDKVNFLAITFENADVVKDFLEKTPFDFEHIVDGEQQLNELKYTAYPTNLILDNNGKVKYVLGEVSNSLEDLKIVLDEQLKIKASEIF